MLPDLQPGGLDKPPGICLSAVRQRFPQAREMLRAGVGGLAEELQAGYLVMESKDRSKERARAVYPLGRAVQAFCTVLLVLATVPASVVLGCPALAVFHAGRNRRPSSPNRLDRLPAGNLHQPRSESAPVAQRSEPPKGEQQRLLDDILGHLPVPREPESEPKQVGAQLFAEPRECGFPVLSGKRRVHV